MHRAVYPQVTTVEAMGLEPTNLLTARLFRCSLCVRDPCRHERLTRKGRRPRSYPWLSQVVQRRTTRDQPVPATSPPPGGGCTAAGRRSAGPFATPKQPLRGASRSFCDTSRESWLGLAALSVTCLRTSRSRGRDGKGLSGAQGSVPHSVQVLTLVDAQAAGALPGDQRQATRCETGNGSRAPAAKEF